MQEKIQRALEQFFPLMIIGIAIALLIGVLVMLSYVLLWGVVIGAILWVAMLIKETWFTQHTKPKSPRIIEHDDEE